MLHLMTELAGWGDFFYFTSKQNSELGLVFMQGRTNFAILKVCEISDDTAETPNLARFTQIGLRRRES